MPGDRAALPRPKRCCLSHCGSISTSTACFAALVTLWLRRLTADCCCCDCSLVWWLCAAPALYESLCPSPPLSFSLSPPTLPLLSLFSHLLLPAVWLSHRLEKWERPRRMHYSKSPKGDSPADDAHERRRRERAVAAARRDGLRAFLPRRRSSKAAASSYLGPRDARGGCGLGLT